MRVVLLDNVRGVGRLGEIKDVSDGYARNFLLPRKLARAASEGSIREVQEARVRTAEASALVHDEAVAAAGILNGSIVTLAAKASAKGKLFAGIEAAAIAAAVSTVAGFRISETAIQLPEHLKTTGDHRITVALARDVTCTVTVHIDPL
jgi:large subunit ribosomal protein L9